MSWEIILINRLGGVRLMGYPQPWTRSEAYEIKAELLRLFPHSKVSVCKVKEEPS
jgi:hypothetical protein